MAVLIQIKDSIREVGIKEIARRSGLSASTVSRVQSGKIKPSLEVVEKLSAALGLRLDLAADTAGASTTKLIFARRILGELKQSLREFGVKHVLIFGSVARGEERSDSDIDIFLDFGALKPIAANLLRAEGKLIEAFGSQKVDIVSWLDSARGKRLQQRIAKDGLRVF